MASNPPHARISEYRPDHDAAALRDALNALKQAERIGSDALLAEFYGQKPLLKNEKAIARSTFDKFLKGEVEGRPSAFGALRDWLCQHERYRRYFPDAAPQRLAAVDTATFAALLPQFFQNPQLVQSFAALHHFVGQYVLYRPNWAPRAEPGFYRVSRLDFEACEGSYCVTETQDFQEGGRPYLQRDTGALFAYGKFAYLLMREATGARVLLFVIDYAYPTMGQSAAVEWFRGTVFGASGFGIFPAVRFFCRRYEPQRHTSFGVMKLDGIEDAEALGTFSPESP